MANVIQDKSRAFAIRIINCYNYLVDERHEQVMSKQLLRCGTSIGANTRESKHAQSGADFLSKMSIAYKEADEVMEQREENRTCSGYPESRQNSTKSN
jgi:four helix bundle protein